LIFDVVLVPPSGTMVKVNNYVDDFFISLKGVSRSAKHFFCL